MRSIFAILVSIVLLVKISGAEEGPKFKIWINSGSNSESSRIAGLLTQALAKIRDVVIVPPDDSDIVIGVVAVFDHKDSPNEVWWSVDLSLESSIRTRMLPAWLLYNGAPLDLVEKFRHENSAVDEDVESINYFWKRKELKQRIDETVRDWDTGAFREYRLDSLKKWYEMDKVVRQKFPNTTALYDL